MAQLPTVRMFMDQWVHTLTPDTDIHSAVALLLSRHVTGAPVVDEEHRVVGILTEKDCLRLVAKGHNSDELSGLVADYMTTKVTTVPPDMDIYFAAGVFLQNYFRRLPVVEGGKLIGAITRFDILRAIQTHT